MRFLASSDSTHQYIQPMYVYTQPRSRWKKNAIERMKKRWNNNKNKPENRRKNSAFERTFAMDLNICYVCVVECVGYAMRVLCVSVFLHSTLSTHLRYVQAIVNYLMQFKSLTRSSNVCACVLIWTHNVGFFLSLSLYLRLLPIIVSPRFSIFPFSSLTSKPSIRI